MNNNSNGMIRTLREMTGNARACIWTEPLWGIPFNLCAAYVSVYMAALGMSKTDIGMVGSAYLAVSMLASIMSGVLTDKLGRKRTTFIFDMIIWGIPELLWAFAQNKSWFVIAAMLNGMMRITGNSWGLLMVEDTEDEMVLRFNALAQLMGLITVFVAPLSGFAVNHFGVIMTMRTLYLMGFVMMMSKFFILNMMATETKIGRQRMEETKNQSLWKLLKSCGDVFWHLLREKRILLTMALIAVFQIVSELNKAYLSLYALETIGVAESHWAYIAAVKSFVTLLCIVAIVPKMRVASFKKPMLVGWGLFILGQLLVTFAPAGSVGISILYVSAVLEGVALSLISPMIDSMLVINADPTRRARIYGLVHGTILLPVIFFPILAGKLAESVLQQAPFVINLLMLALGAILTVRLSKERQLAS